MVHWLGDPLGVSQGYVTEDVCLKPFIDAAAI